MLWLNYLVRKKKECIEIIFGPHCGTHTQLEEIGGLGCADFTLTTEAADSSETLVLFANTLHFITSHHSKS
jgi:hypothetical protein